MQAGERPAGCEYCWKIEDLGPKTVYQTEYTNQTYIQMKI